jgi:hypothetical protein
MKKLLGAALVALFCAGPAGANWCICGSSLPGKVEVGWSFHIKACQGSCAGGVLGPWYDYWPLEAHFQVPAPCAYPYWPPGQALPNGQTAAIPPPAGPSPHAPAPMMTVPPPGPVGLPPGVAPSPDALKPANFHAPAVQPVGYYAPVPSYWYGR